MPRRVTINTNLPIFQYKILNNLLHLNQKLFKFKIRKMKPPYTSFIATIKQNLFGLNCKSY